MWLWKQASVIGTPWITLQGGSPSKAPRGAAEHIINWGSQPREDRGEGATHSPGVSILTSDGLLPASSENWNWNWDNRLVGNITNKGRPPEKKWVTLSPWGGRGEVKRNSLFSPNLPGAEIVQKLTPGDNVTSFNRFSFPQVILLKQRQRTGFCSMYSDKRRHPWIGLMRKDGGNINWIEMENNIFHLPQNVEISFPFSAVIVSARGLLL